MNPLESRIEAAAAAAAAEITPADIPELRLPPARILRSRLARPRTPPERRRWLAPLAAGASVAAVLAGLVIAGHTPWSGRGGTWSESAAVSRAQRLLAKEALDAYFPATGAQYTTGLTFAWTRQRTLARDTSICMAVAGFPQPPFSWSKREFVLHFTDYSRFPDLAQRLRIRTGNPLNGAIGGQQSGAVQKAQRRAYAAATRNCMARHALPIVRLDKASGPLSALWLKRIGRIQSSTRVRAKRAGFVSCLESAGVPGRYAKLGGSDGNEIFAGFFGWMNALGRAGTGHKQVAQTERIWAPVFVTCARPTITTMERIQIAAREKFFVAHAGQIAAIRRIVIELLPGQRK